MQTKLTLRLDEALIQSAKAYAQDANKSVSQIVADYFTVLADQRRETDFDPSSLPPITQRLIGSVKATDIDEDDYYAYLMEKHQ